MAVSYGLHTSKKAESRAFICDSNYSGLFMENESRNGYIVGVHKLDAPNKCVIVGSSILECRVWGRSY